MGKDASILLADEPVGVIKVDSLLNQLSDDATRLTSHEWQVVSRWVFRNRARVTGAHHQGLNLHPLTFGEAVQLITIIRGAD